MTEVNNETRSAGRGLVAIAGAKVYFIITSYAVQLLLPRIFGEPKEFGLYASAMSGLAMLNNVLVVSTIQSVSKFTSADELRAPVILRQGLGFQLAVGSGLAVVVYLGAPLLSRILLDVQLTQLFRVMSLVVLAYALYAALVGSLNGRRLFGRQAKLDVAFSTIRTTGILVGAVVGMSALGAVTGFASAAGFIVLTALVFVGVGAKGRGAPLGEWIAFAAPIWLYQGFLNGILQIDVQVLKRTVAELAIQAGHIGSVAADIANQNVGYYRAAQTFAFVPYQLIISMTFIVFPLVSRATSSGDEHARRKTIHTALRFSLIALLAVAAPIAGAADGVMRIAYPELYLAGAPALRILVLGMVAFALFVVAGTILSSSGRPAVSALIGALGLFVVVAANRLFILKVGIGELTLQAAAMGTTLGMVVALVTAAAAVQLRFHAFIAPKTALRTLVAACFAYGAAAYFPHDSRTMAAAALVMGGLTYLTVLVALREIDRSDLKAVRGILGRP